MMTHMCRGSSYCDHTTKQKVEWHGEDVFASLKVSKTQNVSLLSPFELLFFKYFNNKWSKMVQVFIFSWISKGKRQKNTSSSTERGVINTSICAGLC